MEAGLLFISPLNMPIPSSPAARPRKRAPETIPSKPLYVTQGGRRYYNDDKNPYCLPCDTKELSRQTLLHELTTEIYGNYTAIDFTVEKIPHRVLDLGCGTALWVTHMNEMFTKMGHPDVEFVGLDVVPVQLDMKDVDFTFVKHDIRIHPLPFDDNTFDYVFARDLALTLSATDMYGGAISEIMRIIKPKGLFELQCSRQPLVPRHRHDRQLTSDQATLSFGLCNEPLYPTSRVRAPMKSLLPCR